MINYQLKWNQFYEVINYKKNIQLIFKINKWKYHYKNQFLVDLNLKPFR